ncbi:hypothetical protein [Helicobacter pylori]|uniref:hypothetical protein n=1 Tax=Helicobacter pylori TaxID=210 RepID=UPI0018D0BFA8|nr:hypothetical protein [Helicobacter pylori]MBH0279110.1 hypothetical protein [Helicobacter pylori]MBH0282034.1 hypothetical protein [Helicobacter pylori]MBH0284992.1 hypothetical protein [Helicobacter pylori]
MNKKQTIVKKSLSKKYSNKPLSIAYYNSNDKNYFIKDSALVISAGRRSSTSSSCCCCCGGHGE